jgi:hypothetical protein
MIGTTQYNLMPLSQHVLCQLQVHLAKQALTEMTATDTQMTVKNLDKLSACVFHITVLASIK